MSDTPNTPEQEPQEPEVDDALLDALMKKAAERLGAPIGFDVKAVFLDECRKVLDPKHAKSGHTPEKVWDMANEKDKALEGCLREVAGHLTEAEARQMARSTALAHHAMNLFSQAERTLKAAEAMRDSFWWELQQRIGEGSYSLDTASGAVRVLDEEQAAAKHQSREDEFRSNLEALLKRIMGGRR